MKSVLLILAFALGIVAAASLAPSLLFFALATLGVITVPFTFKAWLATFIVMALCGVVKLHVSTK